MRNSIVLLLVNLLFCLSLTAQDEFSFEATTDAKQVVLGSYFEVSFTLNNAEGTYFKPPSFKDFVVLNKVPYQSTSLKGVNGKWTRTVSYSYSLQPRTTGTFAIGPATIQVNGKTVKSNSITIDVLQGKGQSASTQKELEAAAGKDMFIKAELNTDEARVGQQVLLDYKLYTTINIENYNITEESEYSGFFANELRRFNSRIVREVIDGTQYSTKILKRVALYPQQTGTLTIDPLFMSLGVAIDNGKRPRSFFSFKQLKTHPVQTQEIKLNVKPLPPNAPESFTGAVGKEYMISSAVSKNRLSTDDALSLRMTITGDGDVKRVQAPILDLGEALEVYDPNVIDENTYEVGGEIKAKKVVEYLILPKKPGNYQIQPGFSYFNTDSAAYVTLHPERFNISVSKGSNSPSNVNVAPSSPESQQDIHYIKLNTALSQQGQRFLGSFAFWGLLLFPLLALGGVLIFKQIQVKRNSIDKGVLKRRRAEKVARKRLAAAKKYLESEVSQPFYNEVSRASFGYVCDKLDIPYSELTKANVEEKLRSLKVHEEHIQQFQTIIQTCEMALFAGKDNSPAMKETYHNAMEVITRIEADLS